MLNGRDAKALATVQDEVERNGGRAMQAAAGATKLDEIEAMRAQIESTFEPVDVLMANAGAVLVRPGSLEKTPEDGWRAMIDANLSATFLTLKSCLRGMKQRRAGNIIPDEVHARMLDMHPLKRLGSPVDVAEAALFLASDQAAWITGIILDAAGGSVLTG